MIFVGGLGVNVCVFPVEMCVHSIISRVNVCKVLYNSVFVLGRQILLRKIFINNLNENLSKSFRFL